MTSFLGWAAGPPSDCKQLIHPLCFGLVPGNHPGSAEMLQRHAVSTADSNSMKSAAFKVFSALGANDEEIRKRIAQTENLMPSLVAALDDPDPELRKSAIRFLLSLSRSVQLLRTTFQDHPMWKPLLNILTNPSTPVDIMLLNILTNPSSPV